MKQFGAAELGASTFCASDDHHDQCGANGLPLTPSAVKILGRFQQLRTLQHPNLCAYVHIQRAKHERLIVVAEHHKVNLATKIKDSGPIASDEVLLRAFDVLCGLQYLHERGVVSRCLEPSTVLFNKQGDALLANYGLYYMTEFGADVNFPIGYAAYLAPEVLLRSPLVTRHVIVAAEDFGTGPGTRCPADGRGDVWALGLVLIEAALGRIVFGSRPVKDAIFTVLQLGRQTDQPVVETLLRGVDPALVEAWGRVEGGVRELVSECLTLDPASRPTAVQLLEREQLKTLHSAHAPHPLNGLSLLSSELRCGRLELPGVTQYPDFLSERSIDEVFYLWQLAGGDLESVLRKTGMLRANPSVTQLVSLVLATGESCGLVRDRAALLDPSVTELPLTQLRERLEGVDCSVIYPLIEPEFLAASRPDPSSNVGPTATAGVTTEGGEGGVTAARLNGAKNTPSSLSSSRNPLPSANTVMNNTTKSLPTMSNSNSTSSLNKSTQNTTQKSIPPAIAINTTNSNSTAANNSAQALPLVIRERDVEYQLGRITLYERLLRAYPYTQARICREARVDIPPLYRAHVWAALLDVKGDVRGRYAAIDKETVTSTDRQIEVDIPRCHQYNELLSSPEGHRKLKRVLKAWVVSHPEYVYWQGLDSLCAPFLHVSFNDEALAFACLDNFIPKYLHKFFLKDNSAVIQEYLAVFSQLLAFHDAELNCHLVDIDFIPDLFAIPWFLTMFAHALPLHKLWHLWDTLLLGDASFPLFVGVAVLLQLRAQLLSAGFNECILLFSDMPELDMERCVQDSIRLFRSTPKSASFRRHSGATDQAGLQVLEEVTLPELKSQRCPHITADDLLTLTDLSISTPDSPPPRHSETTPPPPAATRPTKSARDKILIIDIRPTDEYQRGALPDSIHLPSSSCWAPDGRSLVPSPAASKVTASRSLVKVIVGSRACSGQEFAVKLLRLGVNKLCVLYKGVGAVRNSSVLVVPSSL